jgi:DNA processing protein
MDLSVFDIYTLFCTEGIGNRKIGRLLCGGFNGTVNPQDILAKTPEEISEIFPDLNKRDFEFLKKLDLESVRAEFDMLNNNGVEIITRSSSIYPSELADRLGPDAPVILFYLGNPDIISKPSVAIVGSRNVSNRGKEIAGKLVESLKDSNISIISGGARGIDSVAHNTAFNHGLETVVVIAHGINHVLKEGLDDSVLRSVLFISQFHPNSGWSPAFAMIRNKTVCALSSAVFVVETAESGGTLNTGETALKMGVPLYVISPTEFKTPPPGNRYLISKGGREIYLESDIGFVDKIDT